MSVLTPYNQNDPLWARFRLGWGENNKTTIGSHGCTISVIGTAAGLTPYEVNRRFVEHKVFVQNSPGVFNIVDWSRIHLAIPWLKFRVNGRRYHYNTDADNKEVLDAIAKNGFCLVEVDFDNNLRTDNKHWVLFTGNRYQIDPWTGNVTPTSKYDIKTGFSIIDRVENNQNEGNNSMADMYIMKSGNQVDLANRASNIVLADKFDELMHQGLYLSKAVVEETLESINEAFNSSIAEKDKEIEKLKKQLIDQQNNPQQPISSEPNELPKTYNGKRVTGIIIEP